VRHQNGCMGVCQLFGKTLDKKIAFVTGSSKGIGKSIVNRLASEGATILLHYFMDESAALDTKKELQSKYSVDVYVFQANLADETEIKKLFLDISKITNKIDIFINNAASGVHKKLEEIRLKDWEWTMNVNSKAPLLCIQKVIPFMTNGGYIINLSSMGGQRYIPEYGAVGASKSVLETLTRYFALELADRNIIVNTVIGGVVQTDALKSFPSGRQILRDGSLRTPAGRLVKGEDIADTVLFLVSGKADMIRGQQIIVDGGYSIL